MENKSNPNSTKSRHNPLVLICTMFMIYICTIYKYLNFHWHIENSFWKIIFLTSQKKLCNVLSSIIECSLFNPSRWTCQMKNKSGPKLFENPYGPQTIIFLDFNITFHYSSWVLWWKTVENRWKIFFKTNLKKLCMVISFRMGCNSNKVSRWTH